MRGGAAPLLLCAARAARGAVVRSGHLGLWI